MRPVSYCLCSLIKPFKAHCNILILQHPNEWRKYYSTAKLVARTLTNARVMRGIEFESGAIEQALSGQRPSLLYPSVDAVDCESAALTDDSTVVVIDGTWDEARKIIRRNPVLGQLPCLTFSRPLRSNYRIRKQPKENYLSTIESVGHMLKLNASAAGKVEESRKYDRLFDVFQKMVDQQLRHFPRYASIEKHVDVSG